MAMDRNVDGYDRIGRLVLGMTLLIVGIGGFGVGIAVGPVAQVVGAALLLLIGAVLVVTGYLRQCPLKRQLRLDTLDRANR